MAFDLRSFKAIFFAINATPIDWESGIYPSLLHLSQQLPVGDAPEGVVQHENPQLAYPQILEKVYERIASDLGLEADEKDRVAFGQSIASWPAFPEWCWRGTTSFSS
ncbi:hypothetical protein LTR14_012235 [Exophiala xenobiotica]|nr:hypothetical protein LTR14_012235 [Exophiala xenobiotica]